MPFEFARETPAWFDEAKLGILITWGAAAIPAFAPPGDIWRIPDDPTGVKTLRRYPYAHEYQNTMLLEGSATARHHAKRYGDAPYDRFVERFRDEMIPRFDAEPLADAVARSGARYVVHYVRLNDGFLPWPSAHPNPKRERWQSERDVVGEICSALRSRGLRVGLGYPGGMDWSWGGLPIDSWEGLHAAFPSGEEWRRYVDAHWRELIDRYEPAVLWNDYCYPEGGDVAGLLRYYFERVPDGVVNNRWRTDRTIAVLEPSDVYSDFVTPEYMVGETPEHKWESIRALGASFGFNREETEADHISTSELIHTLVDVVARGGNLLLGVGLTATGEVPWLQAQRLQALGWWLRGHGEAIFGTRPWERVRGITERGVEVRYTQSADAVHAIVLGTPPEASVEVDVRLREEAVVRLGDRSAELRWENSPCGVRIRLPECLDEQPAISLRLSPADAVTPHSETPRYES